MGKAGWVRRSAVKQGLTELKGTEHNPQSAECTRCHWLAHSI